MNWCSWLLVLRYYTCVSDAYKILMFNPTYSTSRVDFLTAMANAIVDAGHTVHVIAPEVSRAVRVRGSKADKTIIVPSSRGNPLNEMRLNTDAFASIEMRDAAFIQNATIVEEAICADMIAGYDHWMELKREGGYDVGIADTLHAFSIMELLRVRHTVLFIPGARSSALARLVLNTPVPPSTIADPFFSFLSLSWPSLALTQRAFSLAASLASSQLLEMHIDHEEAALHGHWPLLLPLRETIGRISLVVENGHPLLKQPEYTTHQVIAAGGLTSETACTAVNDEMLRVADAAVLPVVLLVFATVERLDQTSSAFRKLLSKTMATLVNEAVFMWRVEGDRQPWMPAHLHIFTGSITELVGHPAVRSLISDLDATTFHEGSFAGVPLVALPLLGDQFYHTAVGIDRGTTVSLDRDTVTAGHIIEAVRRSLADEGLISAAASLAKRLRRWPLRPTAHFLRHVEYVAEYGRPLGLEFARVPFWTYYCLDILVPTTVACLAVVYAILRLWLGGYYQIYLKMKRNIKDKRELDSNSEGEEDEEPDEPQPREAPNHGHGHSHSALPECDCWRHDPGVIDLCEALIAGDQGATQREDEQLRRRRLQHTTIDQ